MNAVSFSLYGHNPKYVQGAIRNAELAPSVYPGWKPFFYVDNTVPGDAKRRLKELGAVVKEVDKRRWPNGMFWRFLIHDEPDVERFIVRDTDSRLNLRERGAVDAWIASGCALHCIRDHPHHGFPMMGGTWAGAFEVKRQMPELLRQWRWSPNSHYGEDMDFLNGQIWPRFRHTVFQHDFCFGSVFGNTTPFPAAYGDWRFCGEVFDESDKPRSFDWEMRIDWMTSYAS